MTQTGESRAALLAAAALAQQWVRAQQAARSDELPTMATIAAQGRPVAATAKMPVPIDVAPAAPPAPRLETPVTPPVPNRVPTAPVPATVAAPVQPAAPPVPVSVVAPVSAVAPATVDPPVRDEPVVRDRPAIAEQAASEPVFAEPAPARRPRMSFAWVPKAAMAAGVLVALGVGGWVASTLYSRQQAAPKTGTAVLESSPAGALVLVDGAQVGTTPMTQELDPGKHSVEFRQGKDTRTYEIEIVRGQQVVTSLDWNAKRTGGLKVESTPAGATVLIDGKEHGATPLTIRELAIGKHTMVIQAPEGSLRRTVTIAEGETLEVSEALFSGFLHVSSSFELQISEGQRVIQLDGRNQALMPPGTHRVRFVNRALAFSETRTIEIKPGDVTTVAIEAKMSSISVTSTVAGEVLIDGMKVGDTPVTNHPVAVGTREIVVRTPEGVRKTTVTVQADQPAEVAIDFAAP